MNDQQRKAQNESASLHIRQATARYIAQLRAEGLSESEIEQTVKEAQLETAQKMGVLPDAHFISTLETFVKDVMKHGA